MDINADEWIEEVETPLVERALFEELTDKHYREGAWEGPLGFLIGGMALPTRGELATQYFEAGNQLLERIRGREVEDFTLANPILFLYRHSIEMLLKSCLSEHPQSHNLGGLLDEFAAMVKSKSGEDVPNWIVARIKELGEIDPASTAFRYGENFDKNLKKTVPVDGELHVDLEHLQEVMRALHQALGPIRRS